jgi:hypothetical protein
MNAAFTTVQLTAEKTWMRSPPPSCGHNGDAMLYPIFALLELRGKVAFYCGLADLMAAK